MGLEGVVGGVWGRRMEGRERGGGGGRQTIFGWGGLNSLFVCLLGDEEEWMSWIWELDGLKGFLMFGVSWSLL